MIYLVSDQTRLHNTTITSCTVNEAVDILKTGSYLQVDCETTGLSFLDDKILLVQIGNGTDQVIFDVRNIFYK